MSGYQERLVKFKAMKNSQIDATPVQRRKKHAKHKDGWRVVVVYRLGGEQKWTRTYATEDIAKRVADAYNRRFSCHPHTGEPWGAGMGAMVLPPAAALTSQEPSR